ncbi:MAG: hypothetical protein HUJ68_03480 [Clostridia bacterium]|nr:hypothetical protein [Clostridia bacterium]
MKVEKLADYLSDKENFTFLELEEAVKKYAVDEFEKTLNKKYGYVVTCSMCPFIAEVYLKDDEGNLIKGEEIPHYNKNGKLVNKSWSGEIGYIRERHGLMTVELKQGDNYNCILELPWEEGSIFEQTVDKLAVAVGIQAIEDYLNKNAK